MKKWIVRGFLTCILILLGLYRWVFEWERNIEMVITEKLGEVETIALLAQPNENLDASNEFKGSRALVSVKTRRKGKFG